MNSDNELTLIRLGFLKVFFFRGVQFEPPSPLHILRRANPIRFDINADLICYILTSLVYLQQGNVKKSKKLMKIVNIDE